MNINNYSMVNYSMSIEKNRRNEMLKDEYLPTIEGFHIGVVVHSADSSIIKCNNEATKILGLTEEQMVGKAVPDPVWMLINDDLTPMKKEDYPASLVLKSNNPLYNYVTGIYRPDKRDIVWVNVNAIPAYNENGIIENVIVNFTDITERKKSELAIIANKRRFNQLIENSFDNIVIMDADGIQRFVSSSVFRILGYRPEELTDIPVIDEMIHPDDKEKTRLAFTKIIETGQAGTQYRHKHKQGGWVYLEGWGTNQLNNPDIRGVVVNARDITERKIAETYSEMGREILQILNKSGNLKDTLNRVLAALKKDTGFDVIGIRLKDGIDFPYFIQEGLSEDFLITENSLLEQCDNKESCYDKNFDARLECLCGLVISGNTDPDKPYFTPAGSFWTNNSSRFLDNPPEVDQGYRLRNLCINQGYYSIALIPVRSRDKIVGLIQFNDRHEGRFNQGLILLLEGVASQIGSELMRKYAEDENKALLNENELILKEVHHRIKNNMNTIKGLISLQISIIENSASIVLLKDIESRVNTMMLLYDKLYCNKNYRELSVKDYLKTLIEEIVYTFQNRGIVKIETDIEDCILNVSILTSIGIIVNELITNTMKYAFIGRDSGLISATATFYNNNAKIVISDNGAGIPESITFENSSGFGMQLINMITIQLGGKINIERGEGTRFVLEFNV